MQKIGSGSEVQSTDQQVLLGSFCVWGAIFPLFRGREPHMGVGGGHTSQSRALISVASRARAVTTSQLTSLGYLSSL